MAEATGLPCPVCRGRSYSSKESFLVHYTTKKHQLAEQCADVEVGDLGTPGWQQRALAAWRTGRQAHPLAVDPVSVHIWRHAYMINNFDAVL